MGAGHRLRCFGGGGSLSFSQVGAIRAASAITGLPMLPYEAVRAREKPRVEVNEPMASNYFVRCCKGWRGAAGNLRGGGGDALSKSDQRASGNWLSSVIGYLRAHRACQATAAVYD